MNYFSSDMLSVVVSEFYFMYLIVGYEFILCFFRENYFRGCTQFVGYMISTRYITIFYQRFEKEIFLRKSIFVFHAILFRIRCRTFLKEKTKKKMIAKSFNFKYGKRYCFFDFLIMLSELKYILYNAMSKYRILIARHNRKQRWVLES